MRNNESNEEKQTRHSNFRAEPDTEYSGPPLGKWLLVVFLVAFAVLGFDRWRKHARTVSVAQPDQSQQTPASPPPSAEAEPSPVADSPQFTPLEITVGIPTVAESSLAQAPAAEKDVAPPVADEKPETEVRYEMKMGRGNSFVGEGSINGKDVLLLADTGASTVVIPERIAMRLGLKRGAPMNFHTGGGNVVHYATTLDRLTLGRIEMTNVPAAINPEMTVDFVLLGMSALKLMDMEYGEGKLVLKHKQETFSSNMRSVKGEDFKRSVKDCTSAGNKFDQQTLDCLKGR